MGSATGRVRSVETASGVTTAALADSRQGHGEMTLVFSGRAPAVSAYPATGSQPTGAKSDRRASRRVGWRPAIQSIVQLRTLASSEGGAPSIALTRPPVGRSPLAVSGRLILSPLRPARHVDHDAAMVDGQRVGRLRLRLSRRSAPSSVDPVAMACRRDAVSGVAFGGGSG